MSVLKNRPLPSIKPSSKQKKAIKFRKQAKFNKKEELPPIDYNQIFGKENLVKFEITDNEDENKPKEMMRETIAELLLYKRPQSHQLKQKEAKKIKPSDMIPKFFDLKHFERELINKHKFLFQPSNDLHDKKKMIKHSRIIDIQKDYLNYYYLLSEKQTYGKRFNFSEENNFKIKHNLQELKLFLEATKSKIKNIPNSQMIEDAFNIDYNYYDKIEKHQNLPVTNKKKEAKVRPSNKIKYDKMHKSSTDLKHRVQTVKKSDDKFFLDQYLDDYENTQTNQLTNNKVNLNQYKPSNLYSQLMRKNNLVFVNRSKNMSFPK